MHVKMRIIGPVTAVALLLGLIAAAGAPPMTTADLLPNAGAINTQDTLAAVGSCTGPNYLVNGSFENGFQASGVGNKWQSFTNGGQAQYGFYDDQWAPVRFDGGHSQLIEINTKGMPVGSPDRYAGILQFVQGPKADPTYEFALAGIIREADAATHNGDDKFRYRVQWGWLQGWNTDWTAVTNWQELPWDTINDRLSPGPMQTFATQFKAPAGKVTIFVRAWKKWGQPYRELDVNLDAISLRTCPNAPRTPGTTPPPTNGSCIGFYVVQRGDSLFAIAARFKLPVNAILNLNGLQLTSVIHPGQTLKIPLCGLSAGSTMPPANPPASTPPPPSGGRTYTVQRGDSLSVIAARFGVSLSALAQANGITNVNRIYPGQVLKIP